MWKIKRFMHFLLFLKSQTLFLKHINGREFIRCKDLGDNLRDEFPFLVFFLDSRLMCGTKCSEQGYLCRSFAWNKDFEECMLFHQRCPNDTQGNQIEKDWEHYEIRVISDIARGRPAQQSSTFYTYGAERGVDGNRNTDLWNNSCTHTAGGPDTSPWWMVDLQAVYYIISVRMLNRGMDRGGIDVSDRLQNVTVTVGLSESSINMICGFFAGPGTLSQLVVLDCPPSTMGRYIRVSLLAGPLTLCEVDVIGFKN